MSNRGARTWKLTGSRYKKFEEHWARRTEASAKVWGAENERTLPAESKCKGCHRGQWDLSGVPFCARGKSRPERWSFKLEEQPTSEGSLMERPKVVSSPGNRRSRRLTSGTDMSRGHRGWPSSEVDLLGQPLHDCHCWRNQWQWRIYQRSKTSWRVTLQP